MGLLFDASFKRFFLDGVILFTLILALYHRNNPKSNRGER